MAMPYSRAACVTSSSRAEPPGWATKLTPWRAAWSMLSRTGKLARNEVALDVAHAEVDAVLRPDALLEA